MCGSGLFSYLTYLHLFFLIVEGNKHRCVNKTSCNKGGAYANEKRKRCNRIPSEITLGRNYPSAGYNSKYADGFSQFLLSFVVPLCSSYVALVVIIRLPTFTKNNLFSQ